MGKIRDAEQETYEMAWGFDQYAEASPGERAVEVFKTLATDGSVLDAGAGSGKAAIKLKELGYKVMMTDITPTGIIPEAADIPFTQACLWDDLHPVAYLAKVAGVTEDEKFDWVYCADTLEHIPPEFTMLVVSRLLDVAKKGVFLTVSTMVDIFGNWVGKSLHQSQRSYEFWRDRFEELGEVIDCRDICIAGIYMIKPRQS